MLQLARHVQRITQRRTALVAVVFLLIGAGLKTAFDLLR